LYRLAHVRVALVIGVVTAIVLLLLRWIFVDDTLHRLVFALTQGGAWPDAHMPDPLTDSWLPPILVSCLPVGLVVGYPIAASAYDWAIRRGRTSFPAVAATGFLAGLGIALAFTAMLIPLMMWSAADQQYDTFSASFGVETSRNGIPTALGWWYEAAYALMFGLICATGAIVARLILGPPKGTT
jgi:hypothetical protein